jgi:hypothetical protein
MVIMNEKEADILLVEDNRDDEELAKIAKQILVKSNSKI